MSRILHILLMAVFLLLPLTALAQTPPEAATEETAAAPAEADAAPAEEEGPQLDPVLTDEGVDSEALELLVLPLTTDELVALADEWQGIAKELTREVVDLRLAIQAAEEGSPEIDPLREELSEVMERRNAAFTNLGVATENLAAKGGDEATVNSYRAYRAAIVATETQKTDWRTLMKLGLNWAMDRDGGIQVAINTGIVVAAFLGLLIVARFARGMSRHSFSRIPNISKLLLAFLTGLVYWLVLAFGLLVVLSALGVNITPLFALVGGATFIIAFAMQDTLANLASGVMIIINRPFDEGDYVSVAGTGGTVQNVSIVSTTVTTPDNQVIVIPNSKVWGDIITNVTASDTRRVDLVFGIGYGDSIEAAQRVLEDVVTAHPMILDDPAPVIRVNELADSSVNFICRPWVKSGDYWTVYWDLMRQVKEAFDANGISIPFPQSDMHLHVSSPLAIDGPGTGSGQAPAPQDPHGMGRPEGAPDFRTGDSVE